MAINENTVKHIFRFLFYGEFVFSLFFIWSNEEIFFVVIRSLATTPFTSQEIDHPSEFN